MSLHYLKLCVMPIKCIVFTFLAEGLAQGLAKGLAQHLMPNIELCFKIS